jgi:NAD(P)-dependent dehydrogenase (short-subunit alcohol dehydrogenase family)
MQIEGAAALVTGANRGLGAAISHALLERGAKVYGGARDTTTITNPDVIPVMLDVTSLDDIAGAARTCGDVSIVVNNAGILRQSTSLAPGSVDAARAEMETNFFGSMQMARAFAPVLRENGGGALVNMLSVLSFISMPRGATYSASKSAAWSLTNALRIELRQQGTLVVAVHAGFIDTDMAAGVTADKVSPQSVAAQIVDAIANGEEEVLADPTSRMVKAALADDLTALYPALQAQWDAELAGVERPHEDPSHTTAALVWGGGRGDSCRGDSCRSARGRGNLDHQRQEQDREHHALCAVGGDADPGAAVALRRSGDEHHVEEGGRHDPEAVHVIRREQHTVGDPVALSERARHARKQDAAEEQLLAEHGVEHEHRDGHGEPSPRAVEERAARVGRHELTEVATECVGQLRDRLFEGEPDDQRNEHEPDATSAASRPRTAWGAQPQCLSQSREPQTALLAGDEADRQHELPRHSDRQAHDEGTWQPGRAAAGDGGRDDPRENCHRNGGREPDRVDRAAAVLRDGRACGRRRVVRCDADGDRVLGDGHRMSPW